MMSKPVRNNKVPCLTKITSNSGKVSKMTPRTQTKPLDDINVGETKPDWNLRLPFPPNNDFSYHLVHLSNDPSNLSTDNASNLFFSGSNGGNASITSIGIGANDYRAVFCNENNGDTTTLYMNQDNENPLDELADAVIDEVLFSSSTESCTLSQQDELSFDDVIVSQDGESDMISDVDSAADEMCRRLFTAEEEEERRSSRLLKCFIEARPFEYESTENTEEESAETLLKKFIECLESRGLEYDKYVKKLYKWLDASSPEMAAIVVENTIANTVSKIFYLNETSDNESVIVEERSINQVPEYKEKFVIYAGLLDRANAVFNENYGESVPSKHYLERPMIINNLSYSALDMGCEEYEPEVNPFQTNKALITFQNMFLTESPSIMFPRNSVEFKDDEYKIFYKTKTDTLLTEFDKFYRFNEKMQYDISDGDIEKHLQHIGDQLNDKFFPGDLNKLSYLQNYKILKKLYNGPISAEILEFFNVLSDSIRYDGLTRFISDFHYNANYHEKESNQNNSNSLKGEQMQQERGFLIIDEGLVTGVLLKLNIFAVINEKLQKCNFEPNSQILRMMNKTCSMEKCTPAVYPNRFIVAQIYINYNLALMEEVGMPANLLKRWIKCLALEENSFDELISEYSSGYMKMTKRVPPSVIKPDRVRSPLSDDDEEKKEEDNLEDYDEDGCIMNLFLKYIVKEVERLQKPQKRKYPQSQWIEEKQEFLINITSIKPKRSYFKKLEKHSGRPILKETAAMNTRLTTNEEVHGHNYSNNGTAKKVYFKEELERVVYFHKELNPKDVTKQEVFVCEYDMQKQI